MPVTIQNDSLNPRKVYYSVNGMTKYVILKGQEVFTITEIDDPLALLNRVSVLKYQIEQRTANSQTSEGVLSPKNSRVIQFSVHSEQAGAKAF